MAIRQERIERRRAVPVRLDFAGDLLQRRLPLGLAVGLLLGVSSLVWYDRLGYSHKMLWLWLAGLAVLGVFFASRSRALPRIARIDLAIPPALALLFAPLYLGAIYRWPVQVSSDELVVMQYSKIYGSASHVDLFGISTYFARPALLFVAWGKMGALLGGVDLFHMRLLEASFGLLGVAISYALFRQILPRWWAVMASCLLGLSHSYLMISRLAMRENTAVLAEVAAFALLLWGLRRDNELATFLGGVAAGLGFYVYYPSRAAFPIWLLFLAGLAVFYRSRFSLSSLLRLGAIGTIGFALVAAPIHISERHAPPGTTKPLRQTLMIYNDGREHQRQWVGAQTQWEGFWINVKYGLGTFNNTVMDHAWIYKNAGHGFADPLTGILLWLGAGVVAVGLIRRRAGPGALLMFVSFVVLWLSFAFIVNEAPNYTRLLVVVPFAAYLVTEGVRWLAGRWRSVRYAPAAIAAVGLAGLAAWNIAIAGDFIQDGRRDGDPIGSTGRYIQAHRDVPGQHFYLASEAGGADAYYVWGLPWLWQDLDLFLKDQGQIGPVIASDSLPGFPFSRPFSLFMTRATWAREESDLGKRFQGSRLRNITPDGSHVVLEVSA